MFVKARRSKMSKYFSFNGSESHFNQNQKEMEAYEQSKPTKIASGLRKGGKERRKGLERVRERRERRELMASKKDISMSWAIASTS